MPTFDYECNSCGFEGEYRDVSAGDTPECAFCQSNDMKKLFTGFNTNRPSKSGLDDLPAVIPAILKSDIELPCGHTGTLLSDVTLVRGDANIQN
ncbi:hypothetical protein CMI41_02580 [Candidatus Pacearchaeota archaeon]|nr:hypothetical protein [Candidatus Pacearchaeota archaeon]|tara:strand:- start:45 stop:326 length:282 start_codon:yes stop_codon:yes gene_type:complete